MRKNLNLNLRLKPKPEEYIRKQSKENSVGKQNMHRL